MSKRRIVSKPKPKPAAAPRKRAARTKKAEPQSSRLTWFQSLVVMLLLLFVFRSDLFNGIDGFWKRSNDDKKQVDPSPIDDKKQDGKKDPSPAPDNKNSAKAGDSVVFLTESEAKTVDQDLVLRQIGSVVEQYKLAGFGRVDPDEDAAKPFTQYVEQNQVKSNGGQVFLVRSRKIVKAGPFPKDMAELEAFLK